MEDTDGDRRRREAVLRTFVAPDGRLERLPARRAKRLVVREGGFYWRSGGTVSS